MYNWTNDLPENSNAREDFLEILDYFNNVFDTTNNEKRKGTNPNAMQSKVAALKDTKHINAVAVLEGEENDDVLYEEFQAFKNDINRNSEVGFQSESDEISFDDWKIKRKQLKEGIGENYKNAFRFFERKEQEVGIVAPKVSSSVARVMGLHSTLDAKSNPLTRKHPPPHH